MRGNDRDPHTRTLFEQTRLALPETEGRESVVSALCEPDATLGYIDEYRSYQRDRMSCIAHTGLA